MAVVLLYLFLPLIRKVNQHGLLSLPAKECVLARVLVSTTMLSANATAEEPSVFINIVFYRWQQGNRLMTAWKDTHHIGKVLKLVKRMVLKTIRSCKSDV